MRYYFVNKEHHQASFSPGMHIWFKCLIYFKCAFLSVCFLECLRNTKLLLWPWNIFLSWKKLTNPAGMNKLMLTDLPLVVITSWTLLLAVVVKENIVMRLFQKFWLYHRQPNEMNHWLYYSILAWINPCMDQYE